MPVYPPNLVRTTFYLSGLAQGYSESYFTQRPPSPNTLEPDLVAATAEARIIAPLRAAMLGKFYQVDGFRCSTFTNDVAFHLKRHFVSTEEATQGNGQQDAMRPADVILTYFRTTVGGLTKGVYLHGAWKSNYGDGLGLVLDPAWKTNHNAWATEMVARRYGWLTRLPVQPTATITDYVRNVVGNVVTLTVTPGTLGQFIGQVIHVEIQGLNGKSELNGFQVVRVASDTSCVTVKPFGVQAFQSAGTMTCYNYGLAVPNGAVPRKITSHKPGKIFFSRRGRLPARTRV